MTDDSFDFETEVIDPDNAPVKYVRCTEGDDELALIPWSEAKQIARAVGSVPNEDLQELVDQWRTYDGFLQREVGKNQCAQDLAGIIRDG